MSIEPKYFDNFLEEHVAQLIDLQLREVSWKYDYDSVKNGVNKHWHVFCGHNEVEVNCFESVEISAIWRQIQRELGLVWRSRISNAFNEALSCGYNSRTWHDIFEIYECTYLVIRQHVDDACVVLGDVRKGNFKVQRIRV